MTLILSTAALPVPERADSVRETIARTVVDVKIDFAGGDPEARTTGAISELGRITVCSVRSNAVTVERTARKARDDLAPRIFLGLQPAGSSLIAQGGREAVLRPGELAFSESTTPYLLADADGVRQHFFSIPVEALGLSQDLIRRTAGVVLAPGHPVADIAAAYFARIAARPDRFTEAAGRAVDQPTVSLLRALITTHQESQPLAREALRDTLALRIMESARAQLGDPQLNAARLAGQQHVSVRLLYKVLAEAGISLSDRIRSERLEACRIDLARPGARVGQVARRWGFTDASSFARQFRQAYGITPREFARQSQELRVPD